MNAGGAGIKMGVCRNTEKGIGPCLVNEPGRFWANGSGQGHVYKGCEPISSHFFPTSSLFSQSREQSALFSLNFSFPLSRFSLNNSQLPLYGFLLRRDRVVGGGCQARRLAAMDGGAAAIDVQNTPFLISVSYSFLLVFFLPLNLQKETSICLDLYDKQNGTRYLPFSSRLWNVFFWNGSLMRGCDAVRDPGCWIVVQRCDFVIEVLASALCNLRLCSSCVSSLQKSVPFGCPAGCIYRVTLHLRFAKNLRQNRDLGRGK